MRTQFERQIINGEDLTKWFVENAKASNRYLYILGMGFDERMCEGIRRFSECRLPFDIWKVFLDEGIDSPSKELLRKASENEAVLDQIIANLPDTQTEEKHISFWQDDGVQSGEDGRYRFVGEINASKIIKHSEKAIGSYSDVIIDVSALPQAIYLCMINTLFKCSAPNQRIYIIASENYSTDMRIEPTQAEESAHEIQGYTSPSDGIDGVLIWYPIIGEKNLNYLDKYYMYLKSHSQEIDEICPVVPFPSVNVRRADDILSEYSRRLFDVWRVDKKNIIYASEMNPLLISKSLYEASESYANALKPLGECKFVFSAITSKLMTIGMLLTAFDLKTQGYNVSILGISNKGYTIKKIDNETIQNNLICLAV